MDSADGRKSEVRLSHSPLTKKLQSVISIYIEWDNSCSFID